MLTPFMQNRLKIKQGLAKTSSEVKAEQPKKEIPKKSAKRVEAEKAEPKKSFPVRQKVAKKSAKRKKEDVVYNKEAKAYLAAHPVCEAQIAEGCTGISTEIHHKRLRHSKDDRINPDNFLAVDRACHLWIGAHPKKSIELGLSESHLKPKK